MNGRQVAVIVGVGPGLGLALARRFANAGMAVAMAARRQEHLEPLLANEPIEGARAYACDATDQAAVDALFAQVDRDLGTPDFVAFNAGAFRPAYRHDAHRNEHSEIWMDSEGVTVVTRQVVGLLARRVVCRLTDGQRVDRGARIGLMKFGSRMDVFMPMSAANIVPSVRSHDSRCALRKP